MRQQVAPLLAALLKDPVATVRIDAAVALIGMGLRQAPPEFVAPLDLAKQLFRARATLNSDDADQDMAAGRFYMLTADLPSAIKAFQTSLKLDPEVPVQYLLGSAYAQQGDLKAAKQVLEAIPMSNSQYESAQKLLQRIAGQ
jgi:cytochrome c-type biogenesis protein CcmH/NrfG